MQELGYRPNSAARALKRGEFRTIGVIPSRLSTTGNSRTLEAIATSRGARGVRRSRCMPVAVPDAGRGARRVHPAGRAGRRRRHRHHGGAPARRGDPHPAARTSRWSWSTPTPATATPVVDTDQADGARAGRAAPARPRPPDGLAPGRPRGVLRGAAPRRRLARRTHRGGPHGAARWCAATGRPSPATGPASNSPNSRTARRCSRPTTRWRWACCAPCTSGAGPCPTTSASSASTTSPRRAPSCRR